MIKKSDLLPIAQAGIIASRKAPELVARLIGKPVEQVTDDEADGFDEILLAALGLNKAALIARTEVTAEMTREALMFKIAGQEVCHHHAAFAVISSCGTMVEVRAMELFLELQTVKADRAKLILEMETLRADRNSQTEG